MTGYANNHNTKIAKRVLPCISAQRIKVVSDGNGTVEPLPIDEHEFRFAGFDHLHRHTQHGSARDLGLVAGMYRVDVSLDLLSSVSEEWDGLLKKSVINQIALFYRFRLVH